MQPVSLCQWEFDSFSSLHWQEKKEGKIDKTKSWIELFETEEGQKLTVFVDQEEILSINADRDQWGTWITFGMNKENATVAQEDQTKSFVDALIAALTRFKQITDYQTEPPVLSETKIS